MSRCGGSPERSRADESGEANGHTGRRGRDTAGERDAHHCVGKVATFRGWGMENHQLFFHVVYMWPAYVDAFASVYSMVCLQ